ncbi:MAG: MBL fold metallo-hydrolase [Candidatus Omnitrophica bacterium]|nr:MBL fold metallo-hydrolase [Candidatus Omnitrophota bacterium]MCK5289283.1 MBL fold metallo-hydrolase [Candidatus Omnitrophota bacterium]MCK5492739.1 MBL fold metallo-hydrolase [Candidatus Omnitrophota bacterium]
MANLGLKSFILGPLSNNCYIVFDANSNEGFLIDVTAPTEKIDEFIKEKGLKIKFIFLTHSHFDHISGLSSYSVPYYIHEKEVEFLKDPSLNGSLYFSAPLIIEMSPEICRDNDILYLGKQPIEVIHTPGHSPGSISLKVNKWLFSGDALFYDSIGRTDFTYGSEITLINSIKEKLLVLPSDTIVYPGHGPFSTIGREVEFNPFLQ